MKKVHVYKTLVFLLAFFISATAGATSANAQTASTMACANIAVNLKYPMTDASTGGAVTVLQNFLKSAGYLAATPNGLFGPQTRNAASAFQRQYNIPASPAGYVGSLTREKIREISCNPNSSVVPTDPTAGTGSTGSTGSTVSNPALGIIVSSPTRYDRYTAGGTITVSIDNPVPNPTSNPTWMSYAVDLVRGDTVFQRFGTVYATAAGRKTSTFTLSSALNKDFTYKIKVTPSCTALSSIQCRQAFSSEFTVFDIANGGNTGSTGAAMIDITSPTSGTVAAGGSFAYQSTISSDKVYSLSFYLIPQSGSALSGDGSYYDSVSGGYSLGSFTPNNPVSNVTTTIPVPSDIPGGTYKVRVYLRPAGETSGSPTQWSALAYDESGVITVTNPNAPANTNTNTGTGNTGTNLVYLASTPFKLLSFNGDFTTPMQTPSLTFTSNGTGNGTLSANICNSISGSFTRTGNVITAPNLTSTMMACTAAIIAPAETSFIAMMTSGATVSLENGRMVLTRNNGDKFVFAYDTASTGTTGTTGTTGATAAEASSTNPYLRVTAPVAGFAYASTSPDINMTWVFGNLAKFRHYGFQVQLQNKLSPGQWEVMVPQTTVTATGTPVKITNEIVNRFVTRTGKTKEELKSGYFLKVFGLGYGTYPANNTSYIDAESPTFTVTPW